jgi:hypothetical protein
MSDSAIMRQLADRNFRRRRNRRIRLSRSKAVILKMNRVRLPDYLGRALTNRESGTRSHCVSNITRGKPMSGPVARLVSIAG